MTKVTMEYIKPEIFEGLSTMANKIGTITSETLKQSGVLKNMENYYESLSRNMELIDTIKSNNQIKTNTLGGNDK